ASSAVPAAARSFSCTRASSGTGVAGEAVRSVVAPTHNVHSFGASAANSDRENSNTVTTRKIRFMSAGLKGLMLLNPSSGLKLPPEAREAAPPGGLGGVQPPPPFGCRGPVRGRIDQGPRLFGAAGGERTVKPVNPAPVKRQRLPGGRPIGTYNHFARD